MDKDGGTLIPISEIIDNARADGDVARMINVSGYVFLVTFNGDTETENSIENVFSVIGSSSGAKGISVDDIIRRDWRDDIIEQLNSIKAKAKELYDKALWEIEP